MKNLFTLPYRDRKDRNPERVPGTCEWFVAHEVFQEWRDRTSSTMLWVSADPGCGKSVLAKHMVDSVLPTTASRTTCYFFFKDDFDDQRNARNALACILHQLFCQREILCSAQIAKRCEYYGERLTASFSELWDILVAVSQDENAGEIVCILDAIDECEAQSRSELARALCKLFRAVNTSSNLKFLLTGRPLGDIEGEFRPLDMQEHPFIRLKGESDAEMEKIVGEIDIYIRARVQSIQARLRLNREEAELLSQRLLSVPNRTYLWVYLTLDLVQSKRHIDKVGINEVTSHLPRDVDEAYEKILARSIDLARARKLLHIVVAATRPLTLAEMAVALALEEGSRSYQDLDLKSVEHFRDYVRDLCGLFVTVVDSRVYLLHQTAKEFLVLDGPTRTQNLNETEPLKWKSSLQPRESHRILWQVCTWYLLFTEFENKPLKGSDTLSAYLDCYVFLDYSANNWAAHFRLSDAKGTAAVTEALLQICDVDSGRFRTWFRIYWANTHGDGARRIPVRFTTLMAVAYFGLEQAVELLLRGKHVKLNSHDGRYGRSALSWASENGHNDVVELLIKGPPLHRKNIFKLLSFSRAKVNKKDRNGRTPLSYAALHGREEVARLLFKAGARTDLVDHIGGTPISYAICGENKAIASLLCKEGRMPGSLDKNFQKLLLPAAERGDAVVVERLLNTGGGIDVNAKDDHGRTPLYLAVENSNDTIVQQLLDIDGIDVNAKDGDGWTPLHRAVENSNNTIVQQLLDIDGIDVNAKDVYGQTLLHRAVKKSNDIIVQQLLDIDGIDVNAKDSYGQTPLDLAMKYRSETVRAQLLEFRNRAHLT